MEKYFCVLTEIILSEKISNNAKLLYVYSCANKERINDIEYFRNKLNVSHDELSVVLKEIQEAVSKVPLSDFLNNKLN